MQSNATKHQNSTESATTVASENKPKITTKSKVFRGGRTRITIVAEYRPELLNDARLSALFEAVEKLIQT